jgi:acyl-CoA reductase-like NAD-dependent aldehyde dehydrogenase
MRRKTLVFILIVLAVLGLSSSVQSMDITAANGSAADMQVARVGVNSDSSVDVLDACPVSPALAGSNGVNIILG